MYFETTSRPQKQIPWSLIDFKILFLSSVKLKIIILTFVFLIEGNFLFAESFSKKDIFRKVEFSTVQTFSVSHEWSRTKAFHGDSAHRIDFRYNDKKRGIKPYIVPALLITGGTALHFSTGTKENFQNWVQESFAYSGKIDDYIQYAPGIAVYGLNALGIKGKNNFGNTTAILVKSILVNEFITGSLKKWVNEERPNGGNHSFPSGHTSLAFTLAQFMHHEYGDKSIWFSIGAYSCATTVGLMRVAKNAHWISDVAAGAGFGMLSTELIYLSHQYKWDKEHLNNLDVFPWSNRKQSGLTMVYTF